MELKDFVERVGDLRNAQPTKHVRERVQEAAHELSRAGDMQMRVELANEALTAFTSILYEMDSDGVLANVDRVTWRVLVPCPWGSAGWRHWGLRAYEAEILRHLLRVRCETRKHTSLFDYNEEARTWHLAFAEYKTARAAIDYLREYPVTLQEWRTHDAAYRARMLAAQNRRRGLA